jgi:MtN3 and saliva related transmembrane protein
VVLLSYSDLASERRNGTATCYPNLVISSAIVGVLAGTLTTASFLPQVRHSFRSRSCRDLSYAMLVVMLTGTALWTLYGVMLHRWPIIVPNAISFWLISALIVMKAVYHARSRESR